MDLSLNVRGDVEFNRAFDAPPLTLVLANGKHPVLCIAFDCESNERLIHTNELCIKFETFSCPKRKVSHVNTVTDTDKLMQLVRIRLQTTVGDLLTRQSLGSRIEYLRHRVINNELLEEIKRLAAQAVDDLDNGLTIDVRHEKGQEPVGILTIKCYIYRNGILIGTHELPAS